MHQTVGRRVAEIECDGDYRTAYSSSRRALQLASEIGHFGRDLLPPAQSRHHAQALPASAATDVPQEPQRHQPIGAAQVGLRSSQVARHEPSFGPGSPRLDQLCQAGARRADSRDCLEHDSIVFEQRRH